LQVEQWQSHYHDERYLSSQDESPDDHRTPEPSNDEKTKSSAGSEVGQRDEENYHVDTDTGKIPRKKRKAGVVQRSDAYTDAPMRMSTHLRRKKDLRNEKPSHSTKHVTHSLLQDELDEDANLMEIEKKSGDVTNPFVFK
jgi:hypothetical protein